jgi:hypothetical protein
VSFLASVDALWLQTMSAKPQSPLHVPNNDKLLPSLRSLLLAFDNLDPAPNRQKALTPSFLRQLIQHAYGATWLDSLTCHAADLLGGGYFFACRSCEFSKTGTLTTVTFGEKLRYVTL